MDTSFAGLVGSNEWNKSFSDGAMAFSTLVPIIYSLDYLFLGGHGDLGDLESATDKITAGSFAWATLLESMLNIWNYIE